MDKAVTPFPLVFYDSILLSQFSKDSIVSPKL